MSEERFTAIESRLGSIEGRLSSVETKLDGLGAEVNTIDNLKALAPDFGPTERKIKEGDDGLREEFDRRLRPLEREHRKHR